VSLVLDLAKVAVEVIDSVFERVDAFGDIAVSVSL
jgi:hypothetical protein